MVLRTVLPAGELVVDEDQACARQQRGVLRQQEVGGGVGVGLLEAARRVDAGHGAAGRVEVGREAHAVGDAVAEAGGRLGVPEDDGGAGGLSAPSSSRTRLAEREPVSIHHGR